MKTKEIRTVDLTDITEALNINKITGINDISDITKTSSDSRKEEKKMKKNLKTRITALTLSTVTALSVAGVAISSASAAEVKEDPNPAITKKVNELNYDENKVLARTGDVVNGQNGRQRRSVVRNSDGTITYIVKTKKTLADASTSSFAFTNASAAECYPGALLLADQNLIEGNPKLLKAQRNDVDLSIRGIGIKDGKSAGIKADPTTGTGVMDAIAGLRSNWDGKDATGEVTMDITKASSEKQVTAALGIAAGAVKKLQLNYNQDYTSKKNNYVLSYRQVYYTVNANMPNKAGELFKDGADSTYILSKINEKTPPVMVSSVDYGRLIMVNIQSENSANDIQAALKAAASKNKVELSAKYKNVLQNATFKYVIYGGSSEKAGELISTTDYSKLIDVIRSEAKFTADTRVAPISYTTRFLKDGKIANAKLATEYEETNSYIRKAIPLNIFGTGLNGRMKYGRVIVKGNKILSVNDDGTYKTKPVTIADVRLENTGSSNKVPFIPADIDLKSVTVSFDYDGWNKTGFSPDQNCFHITSTANGENIDRVDIEIEGTSRGFVCGYYVEGYVWINKNVSSSTSGRHSDTGAVARDFYIHDK